MTLQDTVRTFANRMYAYRVEKKMTQEELADLLELDNSYVSLLERGARVPSLIALDKIAEVFGVLPQDLLVEPEKGKEKTFTQIELEYLITDGDPAVIDKIHRIMKILDEKE